MTSKSKTVLPSIAYPYRFWDTLDESILNQDPRHSKNVSLYPSEANATVKNEHGETVVLGGCMRKSWFRNKAQRAEKDKEYQTKHFEEIISKDFSAGDLWKFKLSSGVERDIHNEAKRAGVYYTNSHRFEWEIPVEGYENALVRGELDLVSLGGKESENKIGIEVKSITGYYGQRTVFGARSTRGHWLQKPQPKDDNLLQTILYTFVFCILTDMFKYFKLVYISRENGQRNEFDVDLVPETQEDGAIKHRVYVDQEPYSYKLYAEDLVASYQKLHRHIVDDTIPSRDYDLQYSDERLEKMYNRGELSKTDTKTYESKGKLKKGDWQCSWCKFQNMCYTNDGKPIDYGCEDLEMESLIESSRMESLIESSRMDASEVSEGLPLNVSFHKINSYELF